MTDETTSWRSPKPWHRERGETGDGVGTYLVAANGETLALLLGGGPGDKALLTAAPDLLEAARTILDRAKKKWHRADRVGTAEVSVEHLEALHFAVTRAGGS